ncbi:acyl-CoA thioester hydrolase [Dyella sp. OK004]|uniref:acyl-CoA thioesterase n=1 Tax=Dyella sp. OK004 TaxID=1855292 RepID=UPI0008ED982D|nr:thioesterase family protein [Dyella sp. OK004]SFS01108.1 acyl-CoA thioester hydrolase [Dyella sp. OK004]
MSSSTTDTPAAPGRHKAAGAEQVTPVSAPTPAAEIHPLFVASIGVRWRDLDAFNHVNNSNYLTYLEEARLQWLRHVPGPWFDEQSMPVLAASDINYRMPIEWPAQLHVELSCERLGNSSITIGHRIVDAEQPERLYSDGRVVMVWMNPATGKPVPLPQAIRDAVEAA